MSVAIVHSKQLKIDTPLDKNPLNQSLSKQSEGNHTFVVYNAIADFLISIILDVKRNKLNCSMPILFFSG